MADQSAEQIATRQSWKTLPPGPMAPVPYIAAFSQQEYARIRRGLIPVEMEDKWFMFWEADSLFLHRSWTGHCVYRVEFQSSGDRFQVARASVSSDNEHYRRGSDQYEAALVDFLIRAILLHHQSSSRCPRSLLPPRHRGSISITWPAQPSLSACFPETAQRLCRGSYAGSDSNPGP